MKKIILFAVAGLFLMTNSAHAATFSKAIGGASNEESNAVIKTSDGGLLYVGYTSSIANGDILVIKTDVDGVISWQNTYGTSGDEERGYCVTQITGGDFVIGGSTMVSGSFPDALLVRISSSGTLVSMKKFSIATGDNAGIYAICKTSDGGYAAVTRDYNATTMIDAVVFKFTSADAISWQRKYYVSGYEYDTFSWIEQTSDGGYILAGSKYYSSYSNDIALLKLTSTGTVSWANAFGGTGTSSESGECVQQTSDGGYIVSGSGYVFKTNSSGAISGIGSFAKSLSIAFAKCVRQDASGNYFLLDGNKLAKLANSDGSVTWCRQHDGNSGSLSDMVIANDGGIAVASETNTFGSGGSDFYFAKTDASGAGCFLKSSITATSITFAHNVSISYSSSTTTLSFSSVTGSSATYSPTGSSHCFCTAEAGVDKYETICAGVPQGVVIGTTAISGMSYSWSPSTALSSTTIAQPTASPSSTDCSPNLYIIYTVQVSGSGCVTNTDDMKVTPVVYTSCDPPKRMAAGYNNDVQYVSPNPSSGTLYINNISEGSIAEIYSLNGEKAGTWNAIGTDKLTLDLSNLADGVYLLHILNADGSFTTEKIILQH